MILLLPAVLWAFPLNCAVGMAVIVLMRASTQDPSLLQLIYLLIGSSLMHKASFMAVSHSLSIQWGIGGNHLAKPAALPTGNSLQHLFRVLGS